MLTVSDLKRHSGKFSRVWGGLCGWKLGKSDQEFKAHQKNRPKPKLESNNTRMNAWGGLEERCQNRICAVARGSGVAASPEDKFGLVRLEISLRLRASSQAASRAGLNAK